MANIQTVSCDNCGILKGETNHWWTVECNISTKSMFIHPFGSDTPIPDFLALIACGDTCLAVLESKIREGVNPLK